MSRRPWTTVELTLLRQHYADTLTEDLATALGRTVGQVYQAADRHGLKKSDAYLASESACRLRRGDNVGAATQFKPGHPTWNAGKPGSTGTHPSCRGTQFKPGRPAHEAHEVKAPIHKPWLEPGHRFSIDWPPGFVSKIGPAPTIDHKAVAAKARQTALARGITGTVNGRDAGTVRAKSGDVSKAQVR